MLKFLPRDVSCALSQCLLLWKLFRWTFQSAFVFVLFFYDNAFNCWRNCQPYVSDIERETQVKSNLWRTEIAAITLEGAQPWTRIEHGHGAPVKSTGKPHRVWGRSSSLKDGREGGSWGRRSLSSSGRAAIFAKGKETGLRGSNF